MPIYLRKATASQELPLGHFVSDTDGKTAQTGLTIANTDIKLWLSGATSVASKNSGGATHMNNGVYYCVLDATDTATVGPLVVFVLVSGALPVRVECVVLDGAVYDVWFGSTAPSTYAGGAVASVTGAVGSVTGAVGSVTGAVGSVTAGVTLAANQHVIVDSGTVTTLTNLPTAPTDWLTAAAVKADAVTKIQAGLSTYAGGDTSGTTTLLTRVTAAVATATAVAAIQTDTTSILTRIGAFTGTGVNTILGFFKGLLSKVASAPSDVGGTFDPATDSTEAIRDRGDAAWVTATGFALAASQPSWYVAPVDVSSNVAAIKAKTDNLPSDPSDASVIQASFDSVSSAIGVIAGYVDTEVAAIKAKTDNLPSSFPTNFGAMAISVGGIVSSDIKRINDVSIGGTGTSGDSWGPA